MKRTFFEQFVCVACAWYLAGAVDAKGAHEEVNGGLPTQHSQRIDSDQDPSMKVTLNGPFSMTSNLFRSCITKSNTAIVRYHYLKFPGSGVEFTRYVPNADQRNLYDPKWQDVNNATLSTSLACATYAQTNKTAMMYQFDGSKCRVSTIRMPVRVPTCGDRNAKPVFIRTSCPEPTVLGLTLTPDAGAMNITWTVNDPCNVSGGFQVKWVNVKNKDVAALNKNVFYYRIKDRFGCETQNVTVTAVDSISLPWGNLSLASADTLSRRSPFMTTLTFDKSVTFIHVSWTSDFNECLRINNYVVTWDNGSETLGEKVFEYNITGLHACQNITVTVKALYDNGSGTSNILSKPARTLPEDPVIENFSATSLYDSITLNWTVRDHCDLLNGLKIRHGGATNTLHNTSRSYKADGLPCNTSYTFDLVPINAAGVEFGSGSSLNATTTFIGPPVMATLTVDESVTSVHVRWTSNSTECIRINNYVVTWDNGSETLGDNVFEYNITGLHACQNITVTVKALYDHESGTSNILSKPARTLPEGPVIENFSATSLYDSITLNWTVRDRCDLLNGLKIRHGGATNTLHNASRSYKADGLLCNTSYTFDLVPINAAGVEFGSGSSLNATTTFIGPPVMATLTVDESVTTVRVRWTSDSNECFRINNYVVTWDNGSETLGDNVFEYYITGLHACQNITVTVNALYDNGSETSNILSEPAQTHGTETNGAMTAVVGQVGNLTSHASYDGVSTYNNFIHSVFLLKSSGMDTHVRIQFQAFVTEYSYDTLKIIDGNTCSGTLLASLTGDLTGNLPTYTSTGRYLVLVFETDVDIVKTGWLLLYDEVS